MVKMLIDDCGCIAFDDTLPVKINHVSELVAEYNQFLNSPVININATAINETASASHED